MPEVPSAPHLLDDPSPDAVSSALLRYGAVLLRNPRQTVADFENLADALMTPLIHHSVAGREREPVSEDGATATVNKGTHAIPLHRELSYAPGTPDLLMFFCENPPAVGGETTLCDGVSLLDRLPLEIVEFLRANELVWRWSASSERWHSTLGVTGPAAARKAVAALNERFDGVGHLAASFDGETLHGTYTSGFLTRPGDPAQDAFCNSLLTTLTASGDADLRMTAGGASATLGTGAAFPAEYLNAIAAHADAVTHDLAWRGGDIVVVDNTRYMHGRRPITGPERRILTRVGHFRA
jgi:alpha-ketoglutarate-dependent taurine dioxygenase